MRRWVVFAFVAGSVISTIGTARAIPAFARRYGMSCTTCHEFHYPRLSSFGDTFRRNGFQLPGGAEDPARARRMVEPGTIAERLTVFREVPISLRLQATMDLDLDGTDEPKTNNRLVGYVVAGGTVAPDVSAYVSFTPFPGVYLHQARVGVHNLGACRLGEGSLNLRAGLLLLLDFQRPVHRGMAPGPSPAGSVLVGTNPFVLDDSTMGMEVNGKPGWGPLSYQLALVAGPPGAVKDPDAWKDLFGRVSYTFWQNTSHELTIAALGYVGRNVAVFDVGGVIIHRRDDFWLAGGDLEVDVGPFDLTALVYRSHHSDPDVDGRALAFTAARGELTWGPLPRLVLSARFETVLSDEPTLRSTVAAAHATWLVATNVLATITWRHDLIRTELATGVAVLETAF